MLLGIIDIPGTRNMFNIEQRCYVISSAQSKKPFGVYIWREGYEILSVFRSFLFYQRWILLIVIILKRLRCFYFYTLSFDDKYFDKQHTTYHMII
jgi:hypothetical protein